MKSMIRVARLAWATIICLCLSVTAYAAVVDGQPSFKSSVNRGVYVWRTSSGDWQFRVLAGSGSGSLSFSGSFQSGENISGVSPVVLEADDQWSLSDSRTVQVAFNAATGSADGLRFANAMSGLCLNSQSGSTAKIYLGKSAVLASTPVDLTGDGACAAVTPPVVVEPPVIVTPPPAVARKFHPGHYIFMMRKLSSQKLMGESVYPGVKGIVKRYTWKQLEPTEGHYDFSTVASDLDFVAARGKQFIVMIEDRTFVDENPLPDYLAHLARRNSSSYGLDGFTAIRWDPYLVSRLNALTQALGQQFDTHPAFEGLIPQEESAPGFPSTVLDETAYTPEKYRDALISVLRSAARSMPQSRVFWMMNFIPKKQDYVRDVLTAVKDEGVVLGGPDVKPDDGSLTRLVYPYYQEFSDQMPIFSQVEPICYHHGHLDTNYPTKYWTMPELFAYGRDFLDANYFFWVRFPTSMYKDSYNYTHALPVIEKNPGFNP